MSFEVEFGNPRSPCPTTYPVRRLRCNRPGDIHSIVIRCVDSQFLFAPDPRIRAIIGYWLADALEKFPGIIFYCFTQLSNHLHLDLKDTHGELSRFMQYFASRIARDINCLLVREGPLLARRYAATPIIDDAALEERIIYTLLNPVKAQLCARHSEWAGLAFVAGAMTRETFTHPFRKAKSSPRERGEKGGFSVRVLEPRAAPANIDVEKILRLVAAKEKQMDAERTTPVLGSEAAARVNPRSRPKKFNRSPRPLCHASDREGFLAYKHRWYEMVARYREASAAYRAGALDTLFPEGTFRPWLSPDPVL